MQRPSIQGVAFGLLLAGLVAWAALVVAAPVLGRVSGGGGVGPALSAVAYLTGSVVCHQRDARSFHLAGAQLPVCGRCAGLYVFAALGALLALAVPRWRGRVARQGGYGPFGLSWRAWLLLAAAPSALTLAAEWSGAAAVSSAVRAAAAAPLGLAVGALMVEAAGFRGRL